MARYQRRKFLGRTIHTLQNRMVVYRALQGVKDLRLGAIGRYPVRTFGSKDTMRRASSAFDRCISVPTRKFKTLNNCSTPLRIDNEDLFAVLSEFENGSEVTEQFIRDHVYFVYLLLIVWASPKKSKFLVFQDPMLVRHMQLRLRGRFKRHASLTSTNCCTFPESFGRTFFFKVVPVRWPARNACMFFCLHFYNLRIHDAHSCFDFPSILILETPTHRAQCWDFFQTNEAFSTNKFW